MEPCTVKTAVSGKHENVVSRDCESRTPQCRGVKWLTPVIGAPRAWPGVNPTPHWCHYQHHIGRSASGASSLTRFEKRKCHE